MSNRWQKRVSEQMLTIPNGWFLLTSEFIADDPFFQRPTSGTLNIVIFKAFDGPVTIVPDGWDFHSCIEDYDPEWQQKSYVVRAKWSTTIINEEEAVRWRSKNGVRIKSMEANEMAITVTAKRAESMLESISGALTVLDEVRRDDNLKKELNEWGKGKYGESFTVGLVFNNLLYTFEELEDLIDDCQ